MLSTGLIPQAVHRLTHSFRRAGAGSVAGVLEYPPAEPERSDRSGWAAAVWAAAGAAAKASVERPPAAALIGGGDAVCAAAASARFLASS